VADGVEISLLSGYGPVAVIQMLSLPEDDVGWERSETERSETKPGEGVFRFFFGVRPAGPTVASLVSTILRGDESDQQEPELDAS
jgi:hypothetical protein